MSPNDLPKTLVTVSQLSLCLSYWTTAIGSTETKEGTQQIQGLASSLVHF